MEYGWTDEVIHNLTLNRFRQVLAAIERRKFFEQRRANSLISWQTRQLAGFIAGGYMTDGKKPNKALEAAQGLHFDEIEKLQLEEQIKRAEEAPLPVETKPGSFERFMGSMGNPTVWKK